MTSGVAPCICCGADTMVEDWTEPEMCSGCVVSDCDPNEPCNDIIWEDEDEGWVRY